MGTENLNLILSTIGIIVAIGVAIIVFVKFIQYISSFRSDGSSGAGNIAGETGEGREAPAEGMDLSSITGIQDERALQAVKEAADKEVARQVAEARKEMDNKYQSIIKEKNLEFTEVDHKYKETLGDKKQTESVLRSIAEGLVVLNDKGEVMMLNPAAERLLGTDVKKQVGKPLDEGAKSEQLMSLVKKKEDGGKEVEMNVKDEDIKKTIRSSSAVIEDDKGQTIGMVSVLTDVTKQKELDQLKSKFFSTVSHELRSPLVAIRNSIALMLDHHTGKLNTDQEKIIKVADRNLKRLKLLVDDILDFSKLEAKKIILKPVPSSIEKVINETCDTFENWAKSRGITLIRKVDKGIPDVKFDPDRITQVLSNIMSNSIKFTPKEGSITIAAELSLSSDEKKEIVVSLKDTGPGIPKEDVPKLFSQYQQVGDRSSKSEVKGTGLGLYISKELVELHKGRIWIESDIGQGAKFIFTLPIEEGG